MKMKRREFLAGVGGAVASLGLSIPSLGSSELSSAVEGGGSRLLKPPADAAADYLAWLMDRYHASFDVYSDADAAGNHFVARARMPVNVSDATLPPMQEDCTENPHSGITCIKAFFKGSGRPVPHWGGWYFLNGLLAGAERKPKPNWGVHSKAGVDLRGAVELSFWARGAEGGERIKFICCGVGRDETGNPLAKDQDGNLIMQPDSSSALSTGYVTLNQEWTRYTIDLRGVDLSYVLGGFGWVAKADQNPPHDMTFFLDDITFLLDDKARAKRLAQPRFLVSYETQPSRDDFDMVLRNVAFVYDNALALMAFLAVDDRRRAKLIADALVYALDHDRLFSDGRLRTAYQAGDLVLPPGWAPNAKTGRVRTPGWMAFGPDKAGVEKEWFEDTYMLGVNTGNMAWAALALLAYHETVVGKGDSDYLQAVIRMGEWIERNCRVGRRDNGGRGGYIAGFETDPKKPFGPLPEHNGALTYRATEHGLDLYAVFSRLAYLDGRNSAAWRERASHAKAFLLSMWDGPQPGSTHDPLEMFWTGTLPDKEEINTSNVPVDIQAWALLSLKDESRPFWKALDFAEKHHKVGQGFDFNWDRDGTWYEGTAQMAAAYRLTQQPQKERKVLDFLEAQQIPSGAMYAASINGLTTGFELSDGKPWLYYHRPHVGATAWFVLAERGINPFWMGSDIPKKGRIS